MPHLVRGVAGRELGHGDDGPAVAAPYAHRLLLFAAAVRGGGRGSLQGLGHGGRGADLPQPVISEKEQEGCDEKIGLSS